MTNCNYSSTGRFVDLVEYNANLSTNHQHPAITINHSGEYVDISYEQYRNIASHAATYFYDQLNHLDFTANRNVALLSHSNSHYLWNLLGLMNINVAPVLLSPRNSLEATVHLLKESKAQALVYQDLFNDWIQEIRIQLPDLLIIPKWIVQYPNCYSKTSFKIVKPLESPDKEIENIALTLHSSGSTSHPKLIPYPNRVAHHSGCRLAFEQAPSEPRELHFLPLFHAGGIMFSVLSSIYRATPVILSPDVSPGSLFSSKKILELIQTTKPKLLHFLPILVVELIDHCNQVSYEKGWKIFETVEICRFGGGPLADHMVQLLFNHNITPISSYGSTETGCNLKCFPDQFADCMLPLTPIDVLKYELKDWGDNLVELVVLGNDPCLANVQDLDDDGNYPTKDLFRIVSKDPLRLSFVSRTDDTIIHINGEKTNPLPMEDKINQCPYIDRCAILGMGQKLNTLLVQLDQRVVRSSPLHIVINSINEYIMETNASAPSHSRIMDEMVYYLPLDLEKKLPVTIKGNLMRRKCANMFAQEVTSILEGIESGYHSEGSTNTSNKASPSTHDDIDMVIRSSFHSCVGKSIGDTDSFFVNGMDSILAIKFRNLITSKLNLNLKLTELYEFDNLSKLSNFIHQIKLGKQPIKKSVNEIQIQVDSYIDKYLELDIIKPVNKKIKLDQFCIAITGANGSLGSFMIQNLIRQSKVSKVYALIRAGSDADAKKKLENSFTQRYISIDSQYSNKIIPLAVKLDKEKLGLSQETYKILLDNLTHVYHVGWAMNFLKGLDAYDDCIAASKNLMKLSVLSNNRVIYNFISTVGATLPTTPEGVESVPEAQLSTEIVNLGSCNGYNLSKLVTETICQVWSQVYDVPLHILRVGQVSGDTIKGSWNVTEHIPLLIQAIQTMKICPDILNSTISWIPVNTAADAIVEIGTMEEMNQNVFSHIVNPIETSWNIVHNAMKSFGVDYELVPAEEFIRQLKSSAESETSGHSPIATLADFFENVYLKDDRIGLQTKLTKSVSQSITNCPTLSFDLMTTYLQFWQSQQFI